MDEAGPLQYHINLVKLLACCTEGKNVFTEIKCHSLLSLDDIVQVVTHPDCLPEVSFIFHYIKKKWKCFQFNAVLQKFYVKGTYSTFTPSKN